MGNDARVGGNDGHENDQHGASQQRSQAGLFQPERERRQSHQGGENTEMIIWAEHRLG